MSQAATTQKIVIATGKRKTSIARAVIKPGSGRIWINGVPLEIWPIELARLKMYEPLVLVGDLWKTVDIKVNVKGGGYMSQADAVRMAIARGLLKYAGDNEELKRILTEYDRYMLSGDPRRTEPEKYMRYSARRRWQKSYR
ncbi:30S ribosomal protein S9 [Desulfurococcaceae archaeon MEX13E-LK6-19]|nr:30S ribosomal protein S9 [Desulfurococcaceae archaeon MEX13E-LK6-19]